MKNSLFTRVITIVAVLFVGIVLTTCNNTQPVHQPVLAAEGTVATKVTEPAEVTKPTWVTEPATEPEPTEPEPTEPEPTEPAEPEPAPITEVHTRDGKHTLGLLLVTSPEPNSVQYYTQDEILGAALMAAADMPGTGTGEIWLNSVLSKLSQYDIAYYTVGGDWAMYLSDISGCGEIMIEKATLYGYPEEASHTIENALVRSRELRTLEGEELSLVLKEHARTYEGHEYLRLQLPDYDCGYRVTSVTVSFSIWEEHYEVNMANYAMLSLPPA